ncbi:MAG: hypothetical protein CVU97_00180 [Firmicutes bacterium HGW-Firmicutes-21]|nr:MAG: hypothetical protein CVU97_00180 [Firmicutes bacterium HGW-Firmicutes-21]
MRLINNGLLVTDFEQYQSNYRKRFMKTKNKIIVVIAAVAVVLGCFIYVFNTPYMKVRMFNGDCITGSFNMTVNGMEYIPTEITFGYDNNETSRLTTSGKKFSIKGGRYGLYNIVFYLENDTFADIANDNLFKDYPSNTPLRLEHYNSNNWNITNIDIKAKLEFEDEEWILDVNISYRYLTDDYKTYSTKEIKFSYEYKDFAKHGGEISLGI